MRNVGAQEWVPVLREIGKQKRRMEEQNIEDCARYLEDAGAEEVRRDGGRLTFRLPDVRETESSAPDAEKARFPNGEEKQNRVTNMGSGHFSLQVCGDRVILSRLLMLEPGPVSQEAQHAHGESDEQSERQSLCKEKGNRLELRSIFRQSDLRRGRLAADILKMNRYVFCLEQTKGGQRSSEQDGMNG